LRQPKAWRGVLVVGQAVTESVTGAVATGDPLVPQQAGADFIGMGIERRGFHDAVARLTGQGIGESLVVVEGDDAAVSILPVAPHDVDGG